MTDSTPRKRLLDTWNHTPLLRAVIGAGLGWAIVEVGAYPPVTRWWALVAAMVLASAFVAAPGTERWAGSGLNSGWAFATTLGLYVGVPETDRIIGVGAVLAIVWLGELTGRVRVDALMVAAFDAVLVWAAVQGAVGRSGAFVAGVFLLGLLIVAPAIALIVRSATSRPTTTTIVLLLGLQLAFAIGVARVGGVRTTAEEAAVVVAGSLVLLAALAASVFRFTETS